MLRAYCSNIHNVKTRQLKILNDIKLTQNKTEEQTIFYSKDFFGIHIKELLSVLHWDPKEEYSGASA